MGRATFSASIASRPNVSRPYVLLSRPRWGRRRDAARGRSIFPSFGWRSTTNAGQGAVRRHGAVVRDRVKVLLGEARWSPATSWADAERRYLEVLAIDPRHWDAYKGIGADLSCPAPLAAGQGDIPVPPQEQEEG